MDSVCFFIFYFSVCHVLEASSGNIGSSGVSLDICVRKYWYILSGQSLKDQCMSESCLSEARQAKKKLNS